MAQVVAGAVAGAIVSYVVKTLLDENCTLGETLVKTWTDTYGYIAANVFKLFRSTNKEGIIQEFHSYPEKDLKQISYKGEQAFHATLIFYSPDQYWSQVEGIFSGKTTEKSKKLRRTAKALVVSVWVNHLYTYGCSKEEGLRVVTSRLRIDDPWDV